MAARYRHRVEIEGGVAVITAGGCDEATTVTTQGHVRLPAPVRHRLGLRPGDKLLLAARPAEARVIVYPPATLDAFLTGAALDPAGEPA